MSGRLAAFAALLLLPGLAYGQSVPADGSRNRLRERTSAQAQNKPQAKAKLDEALRNFNAPDQPTRLQGVGQLGTVEDEPKAVGYLLQGAHDPDTAVRLKSIDVLGQMRAKDAVAPLVQQLFMRATDEVAKQHILVALGRIGDPRAVKPIVDFLARDGDRRTRGTAIFALGEIRDEAALEPLGRMAEQTDDATIRSVAQTAMQKIRDRPAPEVVPSALLQERLRAQAAGGGSETP
jgi:bilin biosynthesis protein